MATSIGAESRVSIFEDKVIDQIVNAVARRNRPGVTRDLDIIQYAKTDKPELPVDGYDLPAFRLRFQGLAMGSNYESFVFDEGRLEITYYHARTDDIRIAERYLEAVRQVVTRLFYKKKQFFGIISFNPLLGIPGADPRNPHVLQLQDQYEMRIK